jgi:hypothetical protein
LLQRQHRRRHDDGAETIRVERAPQPLHGLNLAKPQHSARETLSDDFNGVGTPTNSSLFPFHHVLHPDGMAFSLGLSLPVHSELRSKPFLRTFPPLQWADSLPI